jgi:hypothetical protein
MELLLAVTFIVGYTLIALEHPLMINKAATAVVTGILSWVFLLVGHAAIAKELQEVEAALMHHLGETASILFFLLGAMTIVEVVDSYDGFQFIIRPPLSQSPSPRPNPLPRSASRYAGFFHGRFGPSRLSNRPSARHQPPYPTAVAWLLPRYWRPPPAYPAPPPPHPITPFLPRLICFLVTRRPYSSALLHSLLTGLRRGKQAKPPSPFTLTKSAHLFFLTGTAYKQAYFCSPPAKNLAKTRILGPLRSV